MVNSQTHFYNIVWRDANFPINDYDARSHLEEKGSISTIKNATTFVFWKYNTGSEEGFRLLDLIEVDSFPKPSDNPTDPTVYQNIRNKLVHYTMGRNSNVIYNCFTTHVLGTHILNKPEDLLTGKEDLYLCKARSENLYVLSNKSTINKTITTISVNCDVTVKYLNDILST